MSLYKRKDSDLWHLNISHAGERVRRSTGTDDRIQAQRIHDEVKAALWKRPVLKGRTWGQAVLLWCGKEMRSESELLSLAKFGRLYPDRLVTDMTGDSVAQALVFCTSVGTYMRYRAMINAILNVAKDAGWLTELPKIPTRADKKKKPRQWITHEQWDKLFLALPEHQRGPAKFAVLTGLRQNNVLDLVWERVSLKHRRVWIEAEDTKGDQAIAVPLSDDAVALLEAIPHRKGHVFLFRGKPFSSVKTGFQAACVQTGLGEYVDGHYVGFTWHGLRHTWATWHAQNGTPLEVLQKLGAWADLRMVMNYAHHSPSHLAGYANNTRKPQT